MMRQNHQQSRAATGNSNAELVSSTVQIGGLASGQNGRTHAAQPVVNEIPLTSNPPPHLTVPSFQNSHLQNSGIQIKDSEIV